MLVLLLSSVNALASRASEILNKYANSDLVKNTLENIENQHGVTCTSGKPHGFFPRVFGSVWNVSYCHKLGVKIKVRISSSFKNDNEPVFVLERLKVKAIWGNVQSEETHEQHLLSDPFVDAFKKSELVRSLRHMVEDDYKIVCSQGKARRGTFLGKANYFYKVNCKSDTASFKLKVKARVQIIGDDVFKFRLKNYKVIRS